MKQKTIVFLIVVGCLSLILMASQADANIIIKVRALNPLESEEIAAISYPLPEEISPSDVVTKKITFSLPHEEESKTTFNIEYVEEEGRYFIIDEVVLGPREVVTLEAHVRDIWFIAQDRLTGIKQTVEDLVAKFKRNSESPPEGEPEGEPVEDVDDETITALQEEILKQFDDISTRQAGSSVVKVGVAKHMEAYYENMEALAQVEGDVEMLRYLLEPEEDEGEGEDVAQEDDAAEELPVEEIEEVELLDEDTPPADPVDLISEVLTLEPEGNTAE
jgi:hypothetical protein